MTEYVSVCVHPDIRMWSRGFGHLLTSHDPLCAYERRSERCAPREKVSQGTKRRREIKRDGRHPSLIDEHRSHWDVPERRSNKARARINAREWSRGTEHLPVLSVGTSQRVRSSGRGEAGRGASRDRWYIFIPERNRPSFFYRWWRFVRSNRDWLGPFALVFDASKPRSNTSREFNFRRWKYIIFLFCTFGLDYVFHELLRRENE